MSGNATSADGRWVGFAAGPADPASLSALATVDAQQLTGAELVDAIQAAEKGMSLLAAVQMRLMAAFAEPFVAGDPMKLAARLARRNCTDADDDSGQVQAYVAEAASSLAAAEIAAALRIAPVTGGIRARMSATMTTELSPTLEALQAGILDRGKARVIADHCEPLSPADSASVQDLVLPRAGQLSTSELREVTGMAVITVDPDGAQDRHEAAASRRELAMTALPDAMATLKAFLPADAAVKIFQVSDLLATGTAGVVGDNRGIGARRVDALVDIADELLTHGSLDLSHYLGKPLPDHGLPVACPVMSPTASASPTTSTAPTASSASTARPDTAHTLSANGTGRAFSRQGRRPHLSVTIGLSTLAGLDNLPGSLAGFGAIPAGLARSIASSAGTICALQTDFTSGAIKAAGALTYRPRQDLRDLAAALQNVCQFPSCRQPAWRCDLDHRDPFDHQNPAHGGSTSYDNTGPACRRHHLFKHHSDWKIALDPAQMAVQWTSPTQHRYAKQPRQAAPPRMWITHRGTAATEHLEAITSTATTLVAQPEPTSTHTEELLAMMLIRHALNTPRLEWEPAAGDRDWAVPADDEPPF